MFGFGFQLRNIPRLMYGYIHSSTQWWCTLSTYEGISVNAGCVMLCVGLLYMLWYSDGSIRLRWCWWACRRPFVQVLSHVPPRLYCCHVRQRQQGTGHSYISLRFTYSWLLLTGLLLQWRRNEINIAGARRGRRLEARRVPGFS